MIGAYTGEKMLILPLVLQLLPLNNFPFQPQDLLLLELHSLNQAPTK